MEFATKKIESDKDPKMDQTVIVDIPLSVAPPAAVDLFAVAQIRKYLKVMKWSAIALSLMQLLFILPMAYPLLVTILSPVAGFFAAHKLNLYLIKLYGIYLLFLVFIQVLTMIILKGTAYIVLQVLFILPELAVAAIAIKAAIKISILDQESLKQLHN